MVSAPFSKNNYDNIYNLTFALLNKQLNSLKYLRAATRLHCGAMRILWPLETLIPIEKKMRRCGTPSRSHT